MKRITGIMVVAMLLTLGSVVPVAAQDCIDINTASEEELQGLTHIGPDRAAQIIELRPFDSVDDLVEVDGLNGTGVRLDELKAAPGEWTPPCEVGTEQPPEPTTVSLFSAPDEQGTSVFVRTVSPEDAEAMLQTGEIEFCDTTGAVSDEGELTDELVTECALTADPEVEPPEPGTDEVPDDEADEARIDVEDIEADVTGPVRVDAGGAGLAAAGMPAGLLALMALGGLPLTGGVTQARHR